MGIEPDYVDGQTPLDPDEMEGLLVPSATTKSRLNEVEQRNIEDAVYWSLKLSIKEEKILSEEFVKLVHRQMFGKVWRWAGSFRNSNKNIGVDKWMIQTELRHLIEDSNYWYKNRTFSPDEMAIRFKHRLVSIHCFPNGNGRHSRLIADIIISKIYGLPVFSWGTASRIENARKVYIHALQSADKGDLMPLQFFARS